MERSDLSLENDLATKVIGLAMEVHTQLGPGLLENAYKQALAFILKNEGLFVEVEKKMPLIIDGVALENGYCIDILVERKLVLELKAVERTTNIHFAQTLNYVKLGKFKLGLLINFNVPRLRLGIRRVINTK
ncbi:GxxExxY protein [Algoriphagus halophytocola]|uniref:GxxExxY protein n=1 Tax=Algoriphagus halophytocola TaxID=2991499 RepID=A0ABY6MKL3_9BACT|nr:MULTISPECIES: GxxExxY protein [unclassified Algoriphagus]UZD23635.1 GxxExxY protein [Algoriphagus sp. TR-M5]WBL44928.1 GxxExxY protein [Algoriphagus sp. TR-M9]